MKQEVFNTIKGILEVRIQNCEKYLAGITTVEDLKQLTLAEAQQLQKFCKEEVVAQTKIVQCDLYHIIGMGKLSPPQMMKFTYLIKAYLKYRTIIKTLACNFDKISELPKLQESAVYKTHGFDGFALSTNIDFLDDTSTLNIPYSLCGDLIKVNKEHIQDFINFWSKKSKTSFSENNFLQKAKSGSDYGGVTWHIDSEADYIGLIKEDNVKALFEGCYKTAQ